MKFNDHFSPTIDQFSLQRISHASNSGMRISWIILIWKKHQKGENFLEKAGHDSCLQHKWWDELSPISGILCRFKIWKVIEKAYHKNQSAPLLKVRTPFIWSFFLGPAYLNAEVPLETCILELLLHKINVWTFYMCSKKCKY